ncbi:S1 family peptidase [Streptomyces sp. NPDC057011]|uniref:S1 family peptidase n=1 Tax=unclassified Streptomyces TaxID=2593676 RepID=UPI0036412CA9
MIRKLLALVGMLSCVLAASAPAAQAVVGGSVASTKDLPFMLMLLDARGTQFCGATLVAPDAAVTAAHCVVNTKASALIVVAGRDDKRTKAGAAVRVSRIWIQPGFSNVEQGRDVAVLHLATPLSTYETARLPAPDASYATGTQGTIAGWGDTAQSSRTRSSHLRKAQVPIVAPDDCEESYSHFNADSMLCAGYQEGGVDTCQGDEGGPLLIQGVLVGITSWGDGCGRPRKPGVYTRVSRYSSAITDDIASH